MKCSLCQQFVFVCANCGGAPPSPSKSTDLCENRDPANRAQWGCICATGCSWSSLHQVLGEEYFAPHKNAKFFFRRFAQKYLIFWPPEPLLFHSACYARLNMAQKRSFCALWRIRIRQERCWTQRLIFLHNDKIVGWRTSHRKPMYLLRKLILFWKSIENHWILVENQNCADNGLGRFHWFP